MEVMTKAAFKRQSTKQNSIKSGAVKKVISGACGGVGLSLVLILIYAFLLYKQILPSDSMAVASALIKVISAAFAAFLATLGQTKLAFVQGALSGGLYALLAFLLFSLLSSTWSISVSLLCDIGMGVVTGMLFAMLRNIFKA